MATLTVQISEAVIKEHRSNPTITELNDIRTPLRYRYLKDRERGSWFYHSGAVKYKRIGQYPTVKTAAVRSQLTQINLNLDSGMEVNKAIVSHFETVSDLLAWHLDTTLRLRGLDQQRKQGIKTAINRYLLPLLADTQMVDLTRPVLLDAFFLPIQERYAISTIRLAFGVLKTACKRAKDAGLLDINPVSDMKVGDFLPEKVKPRAAILEPRHLPELLNQVLNGKHSYDSVMVGVMLLHGTRIGETRLARWDQFDFIDNTWTIPANITKGNSPELTVMLTDTSVELLKRHKQWQKKRGYSGAWLFRGSVRSAMTPTQANNCIQRFSDREWTAHHLRKAYKDLLRVVGTDFLVGERMLNHSLTTLIKTYNQKELLDKAFDANQKAHKWLLDRVDLL